MSRRKSKGPPTVRIFRCEECGSLNPATKAKGVTGTGHKKHMFCYRCGTTTPHIQIDTK